MVHYAELRFVTFIDSYIAKYYRVSHGSGFERRAFTLGLDVRDKKADKVVILIQAR